MRKQILSALFVCICAVLAVLARPTVATAGEFNHRTVFTLNQPIRIPGNVVLPAGKYVIKLVDPVMAPQLVRIMDDKETKTYATVFGIPETVKRIMEKPLFGFGEPAQNSEPQLTTWYYPGSDVALTFPETRTAEKAIASGTVAPSEMPARQALQQYR